MATASQNNGNALLWTILIALGFLFGKTCNCGNKHEYSSDYTAAPVQRSPPVTKADTTFRHDIVFERQYSKAKHKKKPRRYVYAATREYIRGPRGGCYYINSNGNKTYVDRSLCD